MAIKSVLPTTNLNVTDIRDTIGCPSNSLADYCVKAKNGGYNGYAFKIIENGYTTNNGYLIDGALPYFNIYSDSSPAEWVRYAGDVLRCRLVRNSYGTTTTSNGTFTSDSYCFDLGRFRGYIHNSRPLLLDDAYDGVIEKGSSSTDVNRYSFHATLGSYNWSKIFPSGSIEKVKIEFSSNITTSTYINIDENFIDLPLSGDFELTSNKIGSSATVKLYLCQGVIEVLAITKQYDVETVNIPNDFPVIQMRVVNSNGNILAQSDYPSIFITNGVGFSVTMPTNGRINVSGYVVGAPDQSECSYAGTYNIRTYKVDSSTIVSSGQITLPNQAYTSTTVTNLPSISGNSDDTIIIELEATFNIT